MNTVVIPESETDADTHADWLVFDPGEEPLWSAHPRLTTILPSVVLGVGLVVGAIVLGLVIDTRIVIAALIGIVPPVVSYLVVTNTCFVVTTDALYVKRGVVGTRVNRVPLEKVQNSSFSQGIAGRLFGYGSVTFEEAGGPGLRFFRIESPQEVRRFVDRRTGTENGTDLPGTPEQWAAVLDEIRALRRALGDRS